MTREREFKKVKKTLTEYFEEGNCGIYNTGNMSDDILVNIFKGDFFDVDICFHYKYFEIFGTNAKEWEELKKFYELLEEAHEKYEE